MPNHENALVDAVMVITAMRDQPYSIARASAFQIPIVAKMLAHIRMFPIYRMQDSTENISRNKVIMQDIVNCMKDGQRILIYPEGDQSMVRQLRPLKKGTFRMAMMALDQTDGQLDLHMVPAGLVYEHHTKMGRHCLVNFGEPVNVREVYEMEGANEARIINRLIKVMHTRMKALMMDIPSREFNGTIEHLREIYVPDALKKAGIRLQNYTQKWHYDQDFARAFIAQGSSRREALLKLKEKIQQFEHDLRDLKLRQGLFLRKNWPLHNLLAEGLLLLATLPLFTIGSLINIVPYKLGQWLTRKVFRSKNFEGTGLFFFGLITHTIWWTIWAVILMIASTWWLGLCFYPFAYVLGYFAFVYSQRVRRWAARWRFRYNCAKRRKQMQQLFALRQDIIAFCEGIWTPEKQPSQPAPGSAAIK